jgi:16S rRNA (cytidine1402-2'-O)-methyltransferase
VNPGGRGVSPRQETVEARPAVVLVGTPIGNRGDISQRAVEALTTADVIAAEDTRRTRPFLTALGIPAGGRLVSFHGPHEAELARRLVERIVDRNERLVCVTDAGMPGISDPGERLVAAAVEAGIDVRVVAGPSAVITALVVSGLAALAAGVPVEVVPGPSAALAALVLSGLPTGRFVFEGFLPRKGRQRSERLASLAAEERTIVLFEAPHRLEASLADLAAAFGPDRPVAVARELTKRFETIWRGTLGQAADDGPDARGEQVIVIGPAVPVPSEEPDDEAIEGALWAELAGGASTRDAAAVVANRLGVTRRRAYALATSLRGPARS